MTPRRPREGARTEKTGSSLLLPHEPHERAIELQHLLLPPRAHAVQVSSLAHVCLTRGRDATSHVPHTRTHTHACIGRVARFNERRGKGRGARNEVKVGTQQHACVPAKDVNHGPRSCREGAAGAGGS
jgi:hypothetical protein